MKKILSFCILLSISLSDWEPVSFPGAFANGVVFNNNSIYMIGPDGAVYKTSDEGATWDMIIMAHDDIQPYGLEVAHKVGEYILISQNIIPPNYNFRAYSGSDGEMEWQYLPYQDSAMYDILSHGNIIYATSLMNEGLMVSTDFGDTWAVYEFPSEDYYNLLHADENFIYINDGCEFYRSSVDSYSWEYITGQLDEVGPPPPYSCTMISDVSPFNEGIVASVYWYGGVGTLFFSSDIGDSWVEVTSFPQEHSAGYYQSVSDLHYRHGTLYAGTASSGSGIFYTDDLAHWIDYSDGLESYNLSVQQIYSTDTGIYKTGGTTNYFRNNLINAPDTGDLNGDGVLDILDIVQLVGMVLEGGYSVFADVDGDGAIDILDVILMVNILVGGLP